MSILLPLMLAEVATPPPTAPVTPAAPGAADSLLPALGLLSWSIAGMAIARVFRRRSVEGPIRLDGEFSPLPILLVILIGGTVWLGSQLLYGAAKAHEFQQSHPGQSFSLEAMSDDDFAFLSTIPAALGLGILLIGDFAAKLPKKIGYATSQLPSGVLYGVVAAIIALPMVWSFTIFLSAFYEVTKIQHPNEHELLKVMKEAAPHSRWLMVVGACIAAPVFEEMLFRGHIQTLIVRLMMPVVPRVALPPVATPAEEGLGEVAAGQAQPMPPLPELQYADPQIALPEIPRVGRWAAILATSFLFAIVHPIWMAPAIFVLSIALGYAYERTGNLWVPILIHAAFNTSSTLVFLFPQ